MKFREFTYFVKSDLYRYAGNTTPRSFLYHVLLTPGYKYSFLMRSCAFLKSNTLLRYLIFPFTRLLLLRCEYKYGISIPFHTQIGSGLYIGHFGGIVVNGHSVIGRNCNFSHQVTLGVANRGSKRGYPVIGDNVYIGPGAKVIGKVQIGNNVAIGANCVVVNDVPDGSVVVGVPGRVISSDGSAGYINKTDYD